MKKPFATAKAVARRSKEEAGLKDYSRVCHGEAVVRHGEEVCHGEDVVCRREERTYVSILVLNQTRLLSHNSQACKFFPNTQ